MMLVCHDLGLLADEIGEDAAAVHAAILAINQALENDAPADELLGLLSVLPAGISGVAAEESERYVVLILRDRYPDKTGTTICPAS